MQYSIENLKQYITWLKQGLSKVSEAKAVEHPYRLVDYLVKGKHKEIRLVVQVCGKKIFDYPSPSKVYANRDYLAGFSPLDASRITELALAFAERDRAAEPERCLQVNNYSVNETGEKLVTFNHHLTGEQQEVLFSNLINNKALLAKILPRDLFSLGFICGAKQMLANFRKMKSIKKLKNQ